MEENKKEVKNEVKDQVKDEVKFSVVVPYNNQYMVAARKKQKVFTGILVLICALFFGMITVFASTANDPSTGAIVIFVLFTAFTLAFGIYSLLSTKPKSKNDNKSVSFYFYNDYLEIYKDDADKNTHKNITRCLLRRYSNKQYVDCVIESNATFEIKIFTGTYNGMPQYAKHVVPKDLIKSEEIEAFKSYLQESLGKDYRIKLK